MCRAFEHETAAIVKPYAAVSPSRLAFVCFTSIVVWLLVLLQVMGAIPGLANMIPQANDKASQVSRDSDVAVSSIRGPVGGLLPFW